VNDEGCKDEADKQGAADVEDEEENDSEDDNGDDDEEDADDDGSEKLEDLFLRIS
jgi:hypothetical protein